MVTAVAPLLGFALHQRYDFSAFPKICSASEKSDREETGRGFSGETDKEIHHAAQ